MAVIAIRLGTDSVLRGDEEGGCYTATAEQSCGRRIDRSRVPPILASGTRLRDMYEDRCLVRLGINASLQHAVPEGGYRPTHNDGWQTQSVVERKLTGSPVTGRAQPHSSIYANQTSGPLRCL